MFKKLVIVVMLLAAPFAQAKMVLACAMMDGHVTERCCCEHKRHNSAAPEHAASNICCAVAVEPTKDISLAAASESAAKKPVDKLWDSSPDLATAPPVRFASTAFFSSSRLSLLSEPQVLNGSRLYLLTARLRL